MSRVLTVRPHSGFPRRPHNRWRGAAALAAILALGLFVRTRDAPRTATRRSSQRASSSSLSSPTAPSPLLDAADQLLVRFGEAASDDDNAYDDDDVAAIHKVDDKANRDDDNAYDDGYASMESTASWVDLSVVLACLLSAALAAGLTMGTVSLSPLELKVQRITVSPFTR